MFINKRFPAHTHTRAHAHVYTRVPLEDRIALMGNSFNMMPLQVKLTTRSTRDFTPKNLVFFTFTISSLVLIKNKTTKNFLSYPSPTFKRKVWNCLHEFRATVHEMKQSVDPTKDGITWGGALHSVDPTIGLSFPLSPERQTVLKGEWLPRGGLFTMKISCGRWVQIKVCARSLK